MRALLVLILFAAPTPPRYAQYADVTLKFANGKLSLVGVNRGRYPSPTQPKRFTGRFDARPFAHGKPLDSFRFDLPLLGDADPGNEPGLADKLKSNLTTTGTVRVPLPDGAEAVEILDRHGGPPLMVTLPKEAATAPPATPPDAGADGPPPR